MVLWRRRESNRGKASFASWAEEASMGSAGSTPEQAKNAVDGAEAEAYRGPPSTVRFVPVVRPPSTVRFVPVAASNQARQPPPIKLEEGEGTPPAAEENMAPHNLL
jgi:hypothetical protein